MDEKKLKQIGKTLCNLAFSCKFDELSKFITSCGEESVVKEKEKVLKEEEEENSDGSLVIIDKEEFYPENMKIVKNMWNNLSNEEKLETEQSCKSSKMNKVILECKKEQE
jgi:hypothetical protein